MYFSQFESNELCVSIFRYTFDYQRSFVTQNRYSIVIRVFCVQKATIAVILYTLILKKMLLFTFLNRTPIKIVMNTKIVHPIEYL